MRVEYILKTSENRLITVDNMTTFCENHGLSYQMMQKLTSGTIDNYKGMTLISKQKKSKEYRFNQPNGVPVIVENLSEFCSENGLNYQLMIKVHNGKAISHKGYTAVGATPVEKKIYQFTTPNGSICITGNLSQFCSENGLNYQLMSNVHTGKAASHKGYTKLGASVIEKKKYQFYNPQGELVVTDNLSRLCRENDLNYQCMLAIYAKKTRSHKGWYRLPNLTW